MDARNWEKQLLTVATLGLILRAAGRAFAIANEHLVNLFRHRPCAIAASPFAIFLTIFFATVFLEAFFTIFFAVIVFLL